MTKTSKAHILVKMQNSSRSKKTRKGKEKKEKFFPKFANILTILYGNKEGNAIFKRAYEHTLSFIIRPYK